MQASVSWGHTVIIHSEIEAITIALTTLLGTPPTKIAHQQQYAEWSLPLPTLSTTATASKTVAVVAPSVMHHYLPSVSWWGDSASSLTPTLLLSIDVSSLAPFMNERLYHTSPTLRLLQPPTQMPWGKWVCFIGTPWGFIIELASNTCF